jgi:hypothetical protein
MILSAIYSIKHTGEREMEDDELLFEIKQSIKKSRTTFQSVINKKDLDPGELDEVFGQY